jgi:uncharacterized membrane protein
VATAREGGDVRPTWVPGFLLGLGLGGFVDGIVLHQVLQWHHMLSDVDRYPMTRVAGLEANTLADGLFHVLTWLFVLVGSTGTVRAWRSGRLAPSWSSHVGLLLLGWGVFNVVEGLVDHQLLGVHHVRDDLGGPLSWDLGFLAFGALLAVAGAMLHRRRPPATSTRRPPPASP